MPESLSVVEHAKTLAAQGRLPANVSTADLRTRLLADKLNIAGPANAASHMTQGSDFDGASMVLPVMAVVCYDKNPRQTLNPKFQEIKAGIKERRKLPGSLAVTKRPGSSMYMLYMGGNTRLLAVQELWQETHDPAFQEINVVYCKWVSESDILSAHFIENDARADTTFWDKAKGLIALKNELEAETGEQLSSRALEDHLRKLGMSGVGSTMIQNYMFATETLVPIGALLHRQDMRLLKPRINALKHAAKQLELAADLFPRLLESTLEKYAAGLAPDATIDATTLCQILDEQVARSVNTSINELHLMLSALAINPTLSGEALRATGRTPPTAESISSPRPSTHHSATRKAVSATPRAVLSSTSPGPSVAPPIPAQSAAILEHKVRDLVSRLCDAAHVNDCPRFQSSLPLGYYMELPDELIDAANVPDIQIRRASWQLLAALSGQFDKRIAAQLPNESRWRHVMQLDTLGDKSFETEYTFLVQGICSEAGAPGISTEDISYFFWHANVIQQFRGLLDLAHAWRSVEPGRFNLQSLRSEFESESRSINS